MFQHRLGVALGAGLERAAQLAALGQVRLERADQGQPGGRGAGRAVADDDLPEPERLNGLLGRLDLGGARR